mmetsp:Transcript_22294/g.62611  ORF Transcript_22294/g.62611 Transcript_22294/m.62611 type:complete len:153 (-) Transcript_22294:179-637(-)
MGTTLWRRVRLCFFDVTSRVTFKNVPKWHRDVVRVCENIPIVLCGNKVDCKDRLVKGKVIASYLQGPSAEGDQDNDKVSKYANYYDISVRSNYNFEKPFLLLARRLTNNPNLEFVPAPALVPPTFDTTAELEQVASILLPDEDHGEAMSEED